MSLGLPFILQSGPSQSAETKEAFQLTNAEQFSIIAKETGRRYRIMISKPDQDPPLGGYSTIYTLDGNATFATGAEAVRLQTRKPKGFEPAILVAVGYETNEPFETSMRYFDYTSPAQIEDLPKRKNGAPYPAIGGDDTFRTFLKTQLIPEIERRFPTNPNRRALFGHSLGGLFVLNTFFTDTHTYSTYIAGSPSVWWNQFKLLEKSRLFVANNNFDFAGKRLLIGVGGSEPKEMVEAARKTADILKPLSQKGLQLRHVEFAEEGHISVLPALLSRSVSFSLANEK